MVMVTSFQIARKNKTRLKKLQGLKLIFHLPFFYNFKGIYKFIELCMLFFMCFHVQNWLKNRLFGPTN